MLPEYIFPHLFSYKGLNLIAMGFDAFYMTGRMTMGVVNDKKLRNYRKDLKKRVEEGEIDLHDSRYNYKMVIPVHNLDGTHPSIIASSVEKLLIRGYDKDDVIIVDDGSTDKTFEAVQPFGVHLIKNPRGNEKKIGSIKEGLDYADFQFPNIENIMILDGDSYPQFGDDELRLAIAEMKDRELAALGFKGLVDVYAREVDKETKSLKKTDKKTVLRRLQYLDFVKTFHVNRASLNKIKNPRVTCVAGLGGVFERRPLDAAVDTVYNYIIGDKAEDPLYTFAGIDSQITNMLLDAGESVGYTNDLIVRTEGKDSWKDLYTQRKRWWHGITKRTMSGFGCNAVYRPKKKKEEERKRGLTIDRTSFFFGVQQVLIANPIVQTMRLIYLPYLYDMAQHNTEGFLLFLGAYAGMKATSTLPFMTKEERKDVGVIPYIVDPAYELFKMIFCRTVGMGERLYYGTRREIKKIGRRKKKEDDLMPTPAMATAPAMAAVTLTATPITSEETNYLDGVYQLIEKNRLDELRNESRRPFRHNSAPLGFYSELEMKKREKPSF